MFILFLKQISFVCGVFVRLNTRLGKKHKAGVCTYCMPDQKPFNEDLDKCLRFLLQCQLVFKQEPLSFSINRARVNVLFGLSKGKAMTGCQRHYLELSYTNY